MEKVVLIISFGYCYNKLLAQSNPINPSTLQCLFKIDVFRFKNFKAMFVLGIPVTVNGSQMEVDKKAQMKLELEYAKYGDILQVLS